MIKNQDNLTVEQKVEWNNSVEKAIDGLNNLCLLYEEFGLNSILGYCFSESLDEYPLKLLAMKAKINRIQEETVWELECGWTM